MVARSSTQEVGDFRICRRNPYLIGRNDNEVLRIFSRFRLHPGLHRPSNVTGSGAAGKSLVESPKLTLAPDFTMV